MGGVSIYHIIFLISALPLFLPLLIKPPAGSNRFGPRPAPQGLIGAIQTVFGKFFDFNGRASRSEYWYFYLFQILVAIVLNVIEKVIPDLEWPIAILNIGVALPLFALNARRLHDRNRSGWWQTLSIAGSGVGGIVLLIWMALPPRDET